MMLTVTYSAAAIALLTAINCTFLILHHDYEDAVVGRCALGAIAFAGYIIALAVFMKGGANIDIHPLTLTYMSGVLIFLTRHTCRFLRALRVANAGDRTGLRRRGDDPKNVRHSLGILR